MDFFRKFYDDVDLDGDGEHKVLCPFHHDHKPSAALNTQEGLFYCYVCNWGGNEEQFVAKLKNISVKEASKLIGSIQAHPINWDVTQKVDLWADEDYLDKLRSLGLSNQTIEEMQLGLVSEYGKKFLGVPIFIDGMLVSVVRYNLEKHPKYPKVLEEAGGNVGYIIPYDRWDRSAPTYIMEGEKDMLMAREVGLNAITLTGGASAKPLSIMLPAFEGTEVVLCYDNDNAGRAGMEQLYLEIKDVCKSVRYIDISEVVKGEKEDFYDYIHSYDGTIFEFLALEQKEFPPDLQKQKAKLTTIVTNLNQNQLKTRLTTEVVVTSEYAETYAVPTVVKAKKTKESDHGLNLLDEGEERTWYLGEDNQSVVLELMEVDAKKHNQMTKFYSLLDIDPRETNVEIFATQYQSVYRSAVVDKKVDGSSITLDLYSFDKLQVGGQYVIEYTMYPHPNKNQRLVGICHSFETVGETQDYHLDLDLLSNFKRKDEETIQDQLDRLYQSAKHHVAKHLDFDLWLMVDLVFNSILEIIYGEKLSGALDVFLLGDTQVGKSETTSKMTELYKFGKFLSLKTSTTVGLIGGSNKVEGSWANTIGAIPRQHKRLVVLEEFSGAKADFIKTMTDIRTSKILRLARASGELEVNCHLRMITISNPINDETGSPRFLETFPNGVIPIMELIKGAEDVGRYDAFMLIPKRENRFNPFEMTLKGTPIVKEAYEHKAEWVYTRKPENVIFEPGVEAYIWEKGEYLNNKFECNFPVFGTTTSKKLARFSVALASVLFNTDESGENIIVTKDIVDYIAAFLERLYTSPTFRLDMYKAEYDSYNEYTKDDVKALESIYPANTILLDFLSKQSRTTRGNLKTISGLEGDKFNPVFNALVTYKFIRINMETVYPTEKFRKVYPLISKKTTSAGVSMIKSNKKDNYDLKGGK